MAISTAFTEAMTTGKMFFGRASLGVVAFGSTPPVDLGGLDVEADVIIRPTGELAFQEAHRQNGPLAGFMVGAGMEVEATLLERTPNILAKLFGKDDADITDNSVDSPKNKEVAWGDKANIDLPYWIVQVQIAQSRAASPLYDFMRLLKAYVDPTSWELAFGRKKTQGAPIKFIGIPEPADATNPGAVAVYTSEYV